jgi:hypothetical protein
MSRHGHNKKHQKRVEQQRRRANYMAGVAAAAAYAKLKHDGERLNYAAEGPYYWHCKAISERMHTRDEKIVAFVHDVIEHQVKNTLGKTPDPVAEEKLIQAGLDEFETYFKNCGYDVSHLRCHVDDLTKRRGDSYKKYIDKMVSNAQLRALTMPPVQAYIAIKVKKADLRHNRHDKRNEPLARQSEADKERLARYDWAIALLDEKFPDVILRPDPVEKREQRTDAKQKGRGIRPMSRVARVQSWKDELKNE